ncbi:MAG: hypothetical protein J6S77_00810 [Clostridia bacterium]|nr:hypothetical protein [Clostridia bacterium]
MKKIFVILCLALALVLCSCGGDEASLPPAESTPVTPEVSINQDQSLPEESVPGDSSQPETEESLPAAEGEYETAQVNASGHFLSEYDCGLDIEVIWTLETTSPGKVLYTAEVYLISYSIKIGARYSDCYLTVNGEKISFTTAAVEAEGGDDRARTHLASVEKELELSYDNHIYTVSVSFPFRGTYNGVALPKLEASGIINVKTDGTVEN